MSVKDSEDLAGKDPDTSVRNRPANAAPIDPANARSSNLADAAIASYGERYQGELVIGDDTRSRVQSTTEFPWGSHAYLTIHTEGHGSFRGTGWFVSPRLILTAGHCVYLHDRYGTFTCWASTIEISVARDGEIRPFATVTSSDFRTVVGWKRDKDEKFDYGAIVLAGDLGIPVQPIEVASWGDTELVGVTAKVGGYPADKEDELEGTMWCDTEAIAAVDERQIFYQIDTFEGESGSAVLIQREGGTTAVGIHAYSPTKIINSATRINAAVLANITEWIAEVDNGAV